MKIEDLTKPQLLLYWMTFHSIMHDTLCVEDCDVLVKNKAFKDKKSISNALYQLHKNGHIVKCNDVWCITDAGKDYIVDVISKLEHTGPKKYTGPKKTEWTDADFGITPAVRAYIDGLEARVKELEVYNKGLTEGMKKANARLKAYEDEILANRLRIAQLEEECNARPPEYDACTAAYEHAAEAFKHAAEAFRCLV